MYRCVCQLSLKNFFNHSRERGSRWSRFDGRTAKARMKTRRYFQQRWLSSSLFVDRARPSTLESLSCLLPLMFLYLATRSLIYRRLSVDKLLHAITLFHFDSSVRGNELVFLSSKFPRLFRVSRRRGSLLENSIYVSKFAEFLASKCVLDSVRVCEKFIQSFFKL